MKKILSLIFCLCFPAILLKAGTTNTVPKFTSTTKIGNSTITDTGSLVTINNPVTLSSNTANTGTLTVTGATTLNGALTSTNTAVGGNLTVTGTSVFTGAGTFNGALTSTNTTVGGNLAVTGTLTGTEAASFGALSATSVRDSGLTTTRIPFSTTGGLLTDNSGFTFNGTTVTATGVQASTVAVSVAVTFPDGSRQTSAAATGLSIGTSISGGAANRVLLEDANQTLNVDGGITYSTSTDVLTISTVTVITLNASGTSTFTGSVTSTNTTVGGNLSVTGTSVFTGAGTFNGALTSTNTTVGGNLSVTGSSTLTGPVAMSSNTTNTGTLSTTGQLLTGSGSAGTPSHSFTSGATTGLFLSGTVLGLSDAGNSMLTLDSSGAGIARFPFGPVRAGFLYVDGSGSAAAPQFSFSTAGGSPGIYKPAANQISFSVNSADVVDVSTNALTINSPAVLTVAAGITGITNAGNASAGFVGEYTSSSTVAANTAASTVWGNHGTISLTAGDWDLSGGCELSLNGSVSTAFEVALSSFTGNTTTDQVAGDNQMGAGVPATTNTSASIASWRQNVTSTTSFYVKVQATFSSGNPQAACRINARRRR